MLRPKRTKRAPARRPFLTEGAPTRNDLRPEGARIRERVDPRPDQRGFGEVRRIPPSSVLDAEAERKLTGGFDRRKNAYCDDCGTLRTRRGYCFCDAPGPELTTNRYATEAKPEEACRKCGMRPGKGEPCICRK